MGESPVTFYEATNVLKHNSNDCHELYAIYGRKPCHFLCNLWLNISMYRNSNIICCTSGYLVFSMAPIDNPDTLFNLAYPLSKCMENHRLDYSNTFEYRIGYQSDIKCKE